VELFESAELDDTVYATLLRGMMAEELQERNRFIADYLFYHPMDPFVRFLLLKNTENQVPNQYDLLDSFYAPHSLQNGGIGILPKGRFIVDLYGKKDNQENTYWVYMELEQNALCQKTVFVNVNGRHREVPFDGSKTKAWLQFDGCGPREILELYFSEQSSSARLTTLDSILRLTTMRVHLAAPEQQQ
jgi:hypothetical protein